MVMWGGVPLALMVCLLPVQSLFVTYYFAPVLVPLAVFGGVALAGLGSTKGIAAITAALVLVSLSVVIVRQHHDRLVSSQDWRGASALLSDQVTKSEAVAFPNSFYRIVAEYYADGRSDSWERATPILPSATWGSLRPRQLDALKRTGALTGKATITAAASLGSSVWLVGPTDTQFLHAESVLRRAGYETQEVRRVQGIELLNLSR
jgi:hypothetical protein